MDEDAIPVLVKKETETLKRVEQFKKLGIWSRDFVDPVPSLSSLAPSRELDRPKDHLNFLIEELIWLADDFKRERQWKKVTAKKVTFSLFSYVTLAFVYFNWFIFRCIISLPMPLQRHGRRRQSDLKEPKRRKYSGRESTVPLLLKWSRIGGDKWIRLVTLR